jgi:membrane protein YdbS with pleckstrin-like domain
MDYKITCICGHSFLISDDTLRAAGGTVACPACQQRLSPAIESPAPPAAAVSAADPAAPASAPVPVPATPDLEPTKRCPFCGEVILAIARKCKHCGEFLDRPVPTPGSPAPAAAITPAAQTAPDTSNDPVFSLTVSQWDNFWHFFTLASVVVVAGFVTIFFEPLRKYSLPTILIALLIAALVGCLFYFRAKSTRVIIRPLRIEIERGMLGKKVTSLELFRVSDIELDQGFIPRILGFGTIKLTTTDADSPELILHQIPRAREVRQYLQTQVPLAARQRGAVYMEK